MIEFQIITNQQIPNTLMIYSMYKSILGSDLYCIDLNHSLTYVRHYI